MSHKAENEEIDILLVEDSPTDVMIAREALLHAKLLNRLHVVSDGVAALDFLNKRAPFDGVPTPDLILLDLNLPRMSGTEVLAEIKQDPGLRRIPVVVLTTSQDESDIVKSYDLHANCYITKPVNFNAFREVVQQVQDFWFAVVRLPPSKDQ